jgi:glutamate synthase (NADPH/NADH) small chain
MDYLTRNTKSLLDSGLARGDHVSAKDCDVIVVGGGDTGADCIGTALRHGCRSVVNFELLDRPPTARAADNPWPQWPRVFRLDYSHEEHEEKYREDPRVYSILSKELLGDETGRVTGIKTVRIDWSKPSGACPFREVPGTERIWKADLILLALGFLGPETTLANMLKVACDQRGNYRASVSDYATNVKGVFAAGDCRRGQSLVVWAIQEGRGAACAVDRYLMGHSRLP